MVKSTATLTPAPKLDDLPAYWPNRGAELMQLLEVSLTELHGRKLEYQEIAGLMGRSTSTAFGWLAGGELNQVESVLRLLELMPAAMRWRLLGKVCRCLPNLEDARLAWSESQACALRDLVKQRSGLTVLQGDENAVGFLLSALGHSCCRLGRDARPVLGVDVRRPERFAAVPGVIYLNQPPTTDRLRQLTREGWAALRPAKDHLVLLNGVWRAVPELHPEARRLSKVCHVVVADYQFPAGTVLKDMGVDGPRLVVTARERTDNRIQVEFQPA